jgi:sugar phosphate isomerase/epimerase
VFRLGYNTNGLTHHRPVDAVVLLADLGYEGVALTPDVGCLDPFALDSREVAEVRHAAEDKGLSLTIETGARYLLDPRRKHFPTLLEEAEVERGRRVDFLRRAIDLAVDLGAEVVSFWAGRAPDGSLGDVEESTDAAAAVWDRLCAGVGQVLDHAIDSGGRLGFEPEPGMFLERPAGFISLRKRLGSAGDRLGLCLDVGHLLCTGDLPVGEVIERHAADLVTVHLDDIRDGVHEHRMFGEGDLDLSEALGALVRCGFQGLAAVELSRDSHRGPQAAEQALGHLRAALAGL